MGPRRDTPKRRRKFSDASGGSARRRSSGNEEVGRRITPRQRAEVASTAVDILLEPGADGGAESPSGALPRRWLAGDRDITPIVDAIGLPRWSLEAVALVRSIAATVAGLEARLWRDVGISPSGGWVLVELWVSGPMRPADLAASLLVSRSGMSQLVANLEKKGLLARDQDLHDRRSVVLDLTKEGRRIVAAKLCLVREALEELESEVGVERLSLTVEYLRRLYRALHDAVDAIA